ncbi:very-long-chain (3R)-3-hydroxyacyl-CoA dehydratase [Parastagonospora nodorum]|nr:very-long-chain (3R)-3-hydroxyacyl-CoA dehydratase [Parastagonospora nodorum]KAH5463150.1 very-long-chain (3R)-3-hydroxyacyl-CoA dehydratase [Parastagonospora nodorum]KAH5788107.1 very-long-chain (3R)-3-hydroxyacyl-CoA dehydratase [Parastagonospora nodorum]KAH5790953.1 very-long-chain (3R)-3-hydroxyacyl-CoA dehydratase [Parastagonospora nodorum]KAH5803529.1 very-long-chain (3R)-3-hydroxyacyl-CoA dehydratase [Parastagonospora nodorum]
MAKPSNAAASRSQKPTPPPSAAKNTYLLAYNALSAALWAGVLYKTITVGSQEISKAGTGGWIKAGEGPLGAVQKGLASGKVYDELEVYTRMVQSLAGLEVLHSLFGIVRAPLLTTLMQVSSRFLLVHAIASPYAFPSTSRPSPAYTTMLLAWSITEVIRYSYFVFNLSGVGVPKLWTWLRYNTFLVLYPLGVASECWLVYKAIEPAIRINEVYGYVLYAILAVYVPGIYVLFTHMLKQRARLMREARRSL